MGRREAGSYGCICVVNWWTDEGGNVSVQQWCFCASWEPSSTVGDRGGDGSSSTVGDRGGDGSSSTVGDRGGDGSSSTVGDRGGDGSDGSLVLQLGTGVGMVVMEA